MPQLSNKNPTINELIDLGRIAENNDAYTIETSIDASIKSFFEDIVDAFNLISGDITPDQACKLDKIQADLKALTIDYINHNKED